MGGIDIYALMESSGIDQEDFNFEDMFADELGDDIIFEFKEDNTVTITSEGIVDTGTYVLDGTNLTITTSDEEEPQTLTIKSITDTTLVLTDGFEGIDLSGSELPEILTSAPWDALIDFNFTKQ